MQGVECGVPQGFRYDVPVIDHGNTSAMCQLFDNCFVVVGDLVCVVVFYNSSAR